ncbi:XdhC family protein, partial [Roseobacter sp. HKCCA0434]|uniref:XdhC family protein n=1 Tax=Roseobacter sp. HKCCA0434 TaxID=3079297 RepID=UPI002905F44A
MATPPTGPVIRIRVARHRGSTPREAGTAMLVGAEAIHGTIGGGALEHEAIATARA